MKYCFTCPVRADCDDYADRTDSIGVWGGKLHSETDD